ncbi:hypothetical protein BJ165DRAFT_1427337 [Panaeolus papilionaceus]|nr:hypothetical protein BJ165DRAFT_1427337 [Panaeolus papilionaceus]
MATLTGTAVRTALQSIHSLRQTQINTYATYSRITLYAYDILLNLDREQKLIWSDPLRPSSVLYYFVRYPVIAKQIFFLRSTPHMPQVGSNFIDVFIYLSRLASSYCDALNRFTFTISIILTRVAIVMSFIMRVYAITERSVFFMSFLSILGLLSTALDIVQVKELSCTQKSNPLAFVITFISLIVFDVMATLLLIWKLAGVVKLYGGIRKLGSESVVGLMMRSGTLYFAVITGIQLGAVILYFLPQGLFSTVLNDYTLIVSSILISRFLLDMRSMSSAQTDIDSSQMTQLPPLQFARRTGKRRHTTTQMSTTRGYGQSFVEDFEDPPMSDSLGSSAHEISYNDESLGT